MNFEDFYKELQSEEVWFTNASMNHKPETVEATARQIWVNGLTDAENFRVIPMKEHKRHLFNKLSKILPDKPKKKWFEKALEEKKGIEPKDLPLTGEAREKRLAEFMAAHLACEEPKRVAPLTARERLNGDVRPLPPEIKEPSEVEKRAAYLNHLQRVRHSRTVTFLEAYPDAGPEEIEAYLQRFKAIDDPLDISGK